MVKFHEHKYCLRVSKNKKTCNSTKEQTKMAQTGLPKIVLRLCYFGLALKARFLCTCVAFIKKTKHQHTLNILIIELCCNISTIDGWHVRQCKSIRHISTGLVLHISIQH